MVDPYTVRISLKSPIRSSSPRCRRHRIGRAPGLQEGLRNTRRRCDAAASDRHRPIPFQGIRAARPRRDGAFDDYWEGKPLLEELVVRFMPSSASRELAMRTGEIDSMRGCARRAADRPAWRKQGFMSKERTRDVWYLHINTRVKPLDDIRVRKGDRARDQPADLRALSRAGRNASRDVAMMPRPISAPQRPRNCRPIASWGYDPAKAKQLLARGRPRQPASTSA